MVVDLVMFNKRLGKKFEDGISERGPDIINPLFKSV
jgi:hypothetical protein